MQTCSAGCRPVRYTASTACQRRSTSSRSKSATPGSVSAPRVVTDSRSSGTWQTRLNGPKGFLTREVCHVGVIAEKSFSGPWLASERGAGYSRSWERRGGSDATDEAAVVGGLRVARLRDGVRRLPWPGERHRGAALGARPRG